MYKALSVIEPYGELLISGQKTLEIRSWIPQKLPLKNVVLVQNVKRLSEELEEDVGSALGLIDIDGFHLWTESDLPKSGCDSFTDGYYAWEISNRRPFLTRPEILAKRKIYNLAPQENEIIAELVTAANESEFWSRLETIIKENQILIDRNKGSAHPRYHSIIYPLDYGYVENTTSMDRGGIDVFIGTEGNNRIQGILTTIDSKKMDSEIKILYNCTEEEMNIARDFLYTEYMSCILVKRKKTST